jgi:glycolate oxidase FAD binding subunit
MAVSARSVDAFLAAIVPSGVVPGDRDACSAALGQVPRWVVAPTSLGQLSAVVALACEEGLAVVPRGSGSSLELGRLPERVDVALDLRRLDAVIEYNPDDLTVTASAGITAGALAARLAPRRQFLAIDPPGAPQRTLGGIVATNASGPLRARYGTMRDLLLGVRFVQADGVVTWGGARVVKSVTGYDVPKLMVGALGSLGVLAELTLRLHPRPDFEMSWLAGFDAAEAAHAFVALIHDSTLQPRRIEFLNAAALRTCGAAPMAAAVAISFGAVEAAVREQGEQIAVLARRARGTLEPLDGDFWMRYERIGSGGDAVVLRITTLATRLAATVVEIERAAAALAPGGSATVTAQATLGVLRAEPSGLDITAITGLVERLRALVAEVDGSVVIERGSARLRAGVDPWGPIPSGALALMRQLKHEFDPRRILNPGRFVGGL